MATTSIEWVAGDDGTPGVTWNPTRGCSRVSEGCRNCFAERIAGRFCGPGQPYEGLVRRTDVRQVAITDNPELLPKHRLFRTVQKARWTGDVRLIPEKLAEPLSWRKPRRVFVNSMSDLFHENLSAGVIDRVLAVMLLAPHHEFHVLTKRPERMRDHLRDPDLYDRVLRCASDLRAKRPDLMMVGISNPTTSPAKRIRWGVSVEDQATADERIPLLLETPAAVRFVSAEPMLGDLSLWAYLKGPTRDECLGKLGGDPSLPGLDWVVAGSESGPGARPAELDWFRNLRDECAQAGVPYFFKQWVGPTAGDMIGEAGAFHVSHRRKVSLPVLDGRQHTEFPR